MVSPVSSEHRDARPIRLLILGGTDIATRSMLPLLITDTAFQSYGRRSYATSERALNAELVVVTVNALDIDNMQLRRGAYIARLLGMPSLTIAVTNMDAVDYSQSRFDEMVLHCRDAISDIGIEQITTVPLSTHDNDNIATPSRNMPWYVGSTLFDYLDTAPLAAPSLFQGFRILMQDFVGHEGTVVGGTIKVDEPVVVMPSGVRSSIQSIYIDQDQSESAEAGMTVAISLADDIAMSGRDIICHGDHEMLVTDQVQAHVIWESAEPMIPGRQYVIKLANQSATAWVSELKYIINVSSMEHIAAKTLEENDIGVCNLSLDRRLACDAFSECRDTGAFVLIDRFADDVVGHGAIDFSLRRARNLTLQSLTMNKQARARAMGQKPIVIWFTGLSGSGKSTVANAVEDRLFEKGHRTYLLDGDNVRHGLNRDLGFTEADRVENIRRFGEVAKLFADAGLIVLVSVISPFRGERDMVRDLLDDGEFVEVFVDASLATCEKRDPKGLYARARKGEIQNFTGIDSPYEVPLDPELVLDTDKLSPDAAADQVIALIEAKFLEDQS